MCVADDGVSVSTPRLSVGLISAGHLVPAVPLMIGGFANRLSSEWCIVQHCTNQHLRFTWWDMTGLGTGNINASERFLIQHGAGAGNIGTSCNRNVGPGPTVAWQRPSVAGVALTPALSVVPTSVWQNTLAHANMNEV